MRLAPLATAFALLLAACASAPAAPEAVEPPPAAAAPEPAAAAADAANTPPRAWLFRGKRADGAVVEMGHVIWRGGREVEVNLMGTLKYIVAQQLQTAVAARPEAPGAAIDQVLLVDMAEFGGGQMWFEPYVEQSGQ